MFELTDGRPSAYQWDTGLYVDCTGLAESDEVHFCRPGITLALHPAMQGETLAAPVPDELLQQAQPIIVFAYVQTATGEITRVSARLCVTARPKPPGYIASPTEALRWENLQEQIENLQEQIDDLADPEAVQQIVEDYLAKNPPTVTETDPTVPEWAKAAHKPSYTASEVGADPSGTAASQVSAHNTGTDTHSDIRLLISGLTDRLNALADSDDTTLDQLSEVVAYIKNNRSLVDAITTNKVSVADIVDNLTTNVANKPLSAAQGVALKALIDGITIPDKLPNPNALTFTGAVTGSYDGSAPVRVEIPSGGGYSGFRLVRDLTLTESAESVIINSDDDGNPFSLSECFICIFAKVTEAGKITYIPNQHYAVGTYMTSTANTATDYAYDFSAYSVGSEEMFFGYETKTRSVAPIQCYNAERNKNPSLYFNRITSYRIDAKFDAGARFFLYGRDA